VENGQASKKEITMGERFSKRFIQEGINCLTIEK
jgi:hypothetical protein